MERRVMSFTWEGRSLSLEEVAAEIQDVRNWGMFSTRRHACFFRPRSLCDAFEPRLDANLCQRRLQRCFVEQVLLSRTHRVNSRTAPAIPLCSPRLGLMNLRGFVTVWVGGVSLASMAPCPKTGPPGGPLFGAARRPQNNQGKRRTRTVLVHPLP